MQNIFERSNALANQLAEEVGNQHKRLQFEKAEAEIHMDNIRASWENKVRLIELNADAQIRMVKDQAEELKKRLMADTAELLQFQESRIRHIEDQLKAYALPEHQEAA